MPLQLIICSVVDRLKNRGLVAAIAHVMHQRRYVTYRTGWAMAVIP